MKKKIEEGRMKMRQDRQKHHSSSTGNIDDDLTSEETQPTLPG